MVYLELDSTYRDRELYPYSSEFIHDYTFKPWVDYVYNFKGSPNDNTEYVSTGTQTSILLKDLNTPMFSIVGLELICNGETARITHWDNNLKIISTETPFTKWTVGSSCRIQNNSTNTCIHCPNKLLVGSGMILYNVSINEYRKITLYKNNFLHLLTPFSNTWDITDVYEIVKKEYQRVGEITLPGNIDNLKEGQLVRITEFDVPQNVISTSVVTKDLELVPRLPTSGKFRYSVFNTTSKRIMERLGTRCSEQMYNISLNNIILPNTIINHPTGKVTTNLPYVYVVLCNETKYNTFITNNINMHTAVFKCPMTDIANINESPFVKISSPMTHKMRLDLSSHIKFSVHLPDGSLIKFLYPDSLYPQQPRYELQIFSCFELTKIKKK